MENQDSLSCDDYEHLLHIVSFYLDKSYSIEGYSYGQLLWKKINNILKELEKEGEV